MEYDWLQLASYVTYTIECTNVHVFACYLEMAGPIYTNLKMCKRKDRTKLSVGK